MSVDLNVGLAIAAPVVTIVGFFLSYWQLKKQIFAENDRIKSQLVLEKLEDVPLNLLMILRNISKGEGATNSPDAILKFEEIMTKILVYGSPKATDIAGTMQQRVYTANSDDSVSTDYSLMNVVYIGILVVQIKYDITGVITRPDDWFRIKLNDYSNPKTKQQLDQMVNEVIGKHKLDKRFKIQS